MSYTTAIPVSTSTQTHPEIQIVPPDISHGGDIWRVARDSAELDLNSSYMYLLFARDFAETCRVAIVDGETIGFVLAYRRVDDPSCLFVWQVAVDAEYRGSGVARQMLDDLIHSSGTSDAPVRTIETTVTDDNIASRRLFNRLAERWSTTLRTRALFDESHFPDDHETERLHLIGPLDASSNSAR